MRNRPPARAVDRAAGARDADVEGTRASRRSRDTLVGVSFSRMGTFSAPEIRRAWSSRAIEEKVEMNREDRAAAEQQTRGRTGLSVPVAARITQREWASRGSEAKSGLCAWSAGKSAPPGAGIGTSTASESTAPATPDAPRASRFWTTAGTDSLRLRTRVK
jgi:hypothetical protein